MLQLRPNCECCGKDLPPGAPDAVICSFECTFCAQCADRTLQGICPNCGGGFQPRPARPAHDLKGGNFLGRDPASTVVKHRPVDIALHDAFSASIRHIPPAQR